MTANPVHIELRRQPAQGAAGRVGTWRHRPTARRVWAVWVLTRLLAAGLVGTVLLKNWPFGTGGIGQDVLTYYVPAHQAIWSGEVPYRDFLFQYPPGSLVFLLLPFGHGSRAGILLTYTVEMLVLDASIVRMLLRSRLERAVDGAWLWTLGGALTLGLMLSRTDLPACITVVGGLLLFGRHHDRRSAFVLTLGALAKVWPAMLLVVLAASRRGYSRRALPMVVGAGAAAVGALLATGSLHGLYTDLFAYHEARGVEVESLAALPALLISGVRLHAAPLSDGFGSTNLAHSTGLGSALTYLTLAGFALVLVLTVRACRARGGLDGPVVALASCAAIGAALLTSKVFSAQYMSWLLATGCVAAAYGSLSGKAERLLLAATGLTAVVFPLDFPAFGQGGVMGLVPLAAITVRDVLLVILVAGWWRELWSSGSTPTCPASEIGVATPAVDTPDPVGASTSLRSA